MNYLYIILGLILIFLLVWRIVHKMKHGGGCCDGHSSPEAKIKSSDRNRRHYPYHYVIDIEGMVCGKCAVKVENAFNSEDGVYAAVNLGNKTADVYTKQAIERGRAAQILENTGYVMTGFREEI